MEQLSTPIEDKSFLGNVVPILMELDPSMHDSVRNDKSEDLSDEEVDEEIVVESPYLYEHENATSLVYSSTLNKHAPNSLYFDLNILVLEDDSVSTIVDINEHADSSSSTCVTLIHDMSLMHVCDILDNHSIPNVSTNLDDLEKGVCEVLLDSKSAIEDGTAANHPRKIDAANEPIPKQQKGMKLFGSKTRRRRHKLQRTKQQPLKIMQTVQEAEEEEQTLSMGLVGNSLELTSFHIASSACVVLSDQTPSEHVWSLKPNSMSDTMSTVEPFPCDRNVNKDVQEHDKSGLNSLEFDVSVPVSFSSFLFSLVHVRAT